MMDPSQWSAAELRLAAAELRQRATELLDLGQPVSAAEVKAIANGHIARADRLDANLSAPQGSAPE